MDKINFEPIYKIASDIVIIYLIIKTLPNIIKLLV
jgi:hypothetical protein